MNIKITFYVGKIECKRIFSIRELIDPKESYVVYFPKSGDLVMFMGFINRENIKYVVDPSYFENVKMKCITSDLNYYEYPENCSTKLTVYEEIVDIRNNINNFFKILNLAYEINGIDLRYLDVGVETCLKMLKCLQNIKTIKQMTKNNNSIKNKIKNNNIENNNIENNNKIKNNNIEYNNKIENNHIENKIKNNGIENKIKNNCIENKITKMEDDK